MWCSACATQGGGDLAWRQRWYLKGGDVAAAAMPLVADDRQVQIPCSSADRASLTPTKWKKLNTYLDLLEILIMPNLYWRKNPVTSGDFVKTQHSLNNNSTKTSHHKNLLG